MVTTISDLFPSRYLKAADLKGQRRILTLSKIASEEVGRAKERKPIVYFQKCTKGMVLNKTNANKIAEVVGSKNIADWPGKQVVLYPTMVDLSGNLVEGIRVDHPTSTGAAVADPQTPPPAFDDANEDSTFGDLADDDIPEFSAPPDASAARAKKTGS